MVFSPANSSFYSSLFSVQQKILAFEKQKEQKDEMADEANEVESKGGNFVVYEENELESKGGNFVDDEAKESESKVPTFMTDEEGKGVESKGGNVGEVNVMEGVASIALLPTGSISGHFIQRHDSISICYGLLGTELACEKECSRGEDYRLIKLAIIDYNRKKEKVVVVECRGHDAARLQSVEHAHGWEEDVVDLVAEQHGKNQILVSFNCETLKSDKAAEDHIRQFLPKLAGLDAVVNIGRMTISGLDFEAEE